MYITLLAWPRAGIGQPLNHSAPFPPFPARVCVKPLVTPATNPPAIQVARAEPSLSLTHTHSLSLFLSPPAVERLTTANPPPPSFKSYLILPFELTGADSLSVLQ